ncbi:MAG TPA: hypothetical protein VH575_25265 [Gemmataceae bacterium]
MNRERWLLSCDVPTHPIPARHLVRHALKVLWRRWRIKCKSLSEDARYLELAAENLRLRGIIKNLEKDVAHADH